MVHDRTGRTALFKGPLTYGADHLLWFDLVAIPFGVIRRAMFPDDLAVDAGLRSCEDWDLWLRCAQTRPIATVPRALYNYHQHGGDRVTREDSGPVLGRQGFLDRHAGSMSSSCRIYHELVVAELGGVAVRWPGSWPPTTGCRPPPWPCPCWPPVRRPVRSAPAGGIPACRPV